MGFSRNVKEKALVAAARHCCVCHRLKGLNIEVHHIKPQAQGGADTFDNAIALCPDCHADAGHYFAGHPRGTRLSPSELILHRNTWYRLVKENNITDETINNCLHFRHIIWDNDVLALLNGNSKSNIIKNALLVPNNIGTLMKEYLTCDTQQIHFLNKGLDYDAYKSKISDAIQNNDGLTNIPFVRIPSIDEMHILVNDNVFAKYLFDNNVPIEDICKIIAVDINNGCGGDADIVSSPLYEELYERKYYLQTLVITNISDHPVKLEEIICQSSNYVLSNKIRNEFSDRVIKFPNVPILPEQNVIIPTGIISNGFDNLNYNFAKRCNTYELADWYESISQISLPEIEYINEVLEPVNIKYRIEDNIKEDVIHRIDYKSLYITEGGCLCGSCPHFFFENHNGELLYGGELFCSQPGVILAEHIQTPKDTVSLVIAELEYESTYLKSISTNGCIIDIEKRLNTGDSYRFKVEGDQTLTIEGKYITLCSNFTELKASEKYRIINSYVAKWPHDISLMSASPKNGQF